MPEVWFVRHGECTANVGEPTRRVGEAPLTEKGQAQAQSIATYLLGEVDARRVAIITSPYRRAQETARIVSHSLKGSLSFFQEWHEVKEFECLFLPNGQPTTAVDRSYLVADFWQRGDPTFIHGKGTESFNNFIARVQGVLRRLSEYPEDGLVIVFSHHQFIQAVEWLIVDKIEESSPMRKEMQEFYRMLKSRERAVPNGAIVQTDLNQKKPQFLALQTSHLDSIRLPVAPR